MLIANAERLFLRHFHIADLDAMADVFGDPEVMRFGRGPQPKERGQDWLRGCLEDYYQKWGFGLWAIVHKSDRRVIGYCGLTHFDDIDGQPGTAESTARTSTSTRGSGPVFRHSPPSPTRPRSKRVAGSW